MIRPEFIGLMIYVITSTFGVTLIKLNLTRLQGNICLENILILLNPGVIIGIFLYFGGFLLWLYVISHMKLSVAYPIAITLSVISVLLASLFILKEKITSEMFLGTLFCLFGIWLIVRNA